MTWKPCSEPHVGDVIRWQEPVWAPPNKKRGKPDNIGEQLVTAEVLTVSEFVELKVREVEVVMMDDGAEFDPTRMKEGEIIKRKSATIMRGDCHRLK